MSPRPRKVSDDEVFLATIRAMQRLRPSELTLAAIADEAGLTPGAIVQRFGSKHRLQVALARGAAASAGEMIRGLRAKHSSPLAAIRDYAECMGHLASSPAATVRNLEYLASDIADADLRRHLLVQSRATRDELRALVQEAVAARELREGTDVSALASVIEAVISGALLTHGIYRQGTAKAWLRYHIDAALAPHVPTTFRR